MPRPYEHLVGITSWHAETALHNCARWQLGLTSIAWAEHGVQRGYVRLIWLLIFSSVTVSFL
jgi:hypothetical protein